MTASVQTKSNLNNETFLNKVAFWKEDKTAMKIVKMVTSFILVPLACLADLINKGINYVWPKKVVEEVKVEVELTKPQVISSKIKASLNTGVDKVKNLWVSNKNAIVISGLIAVVAISSYYVYPAIDL